MLPRHIGSKIKETNTQIISQSFGLISSALVLVAALAWNDLVKDLITTYLQTGGGLISRFIYALLVTVIAAVVATKLAKLSEKMAGSQFEKTNPE